MTTDADVELDRLVERIETGERGTDDNRDTLLDFAGARAFQPNKIGHPLTD